MTHTLEITLKLGIPIGLVIGMMVGVLTAPMPDDICLFMTDHSHQEGHQLLILLRRGRVSLFMDVFDEFLYEGRPVGSFSCIRVTTCVAPIREGTAGM